MAYQAQDTQPERTALAWSRTSLALFVGTIWVCRLALVGQSSTGLVVLIISSAMMGANCFLLQSRKRRLRLGVDASAASGIENLLVVLQILLLAIAALLQ